ncbi:hypothetical protein ERO13_A01G118600v2 [Gossypium hirsutum]|uniref:Uncharacterized protein n=1 Tax=Gossypium tomentosum TaxID=34277 RepID=A0A5D2RU37_GOSTO|nr:hypothetical protein ERO13_A01G118600v2 [Gossypium hirsutum]TYI43034.1 hypothetical protein ES332_A01G140400v1 [Gossypium tomentosum]
MNLEKAAYSTPVISTTAVLHITIRIVISVLSSLSVDSLAQKINIHCYLHNSSIPHHRLLVWISCPTTFRRRVMQIRFSLYQMAHYCEGLTLMPKVHQHSGGRSGSSLVERSVEIYLNHCCLPMINIRSCTSRFLEYHISHRA